MDHPHFRILRNKIRSLRRLALAGRVSPAHAEYDLGRLVDEANAACQRAQHMTVGATLLRDFDAVVREGQAAIEAVRALRLTADLAVGAGVVGHRQGIDPHAETVLMGREDRSGLHRIGRDTSFVKGRFVHICDLAEGGQARVVLAFDRVSDSKRVLKIYERPDEQARRRCQREFEIGSQLGQQQHVVQILELHEEPQADRIVVVMEWIDGVTLNQFAGGRSLAEPELRQLVVQLAEGLSAIHALGYIHKDIKPENVMLVSDGAQLHAKLIDLGVAAPIAQDEAPLDPIDEEKKKKRFTAPGTFFTTPRYAPWEVITGQAGTPASDGYSLAHVVQECALGRELPGFTFGEGKLTEPPVPPCPPNISAGLWALLAQMRQRRPADRPQSADEVIARVKQLGSATRPTHGGRAPSAAWSPAPQCVPSGGCPAGSEPEQHQPPEEDPVAIPMHQGASRLVALSAVVLATLLLAFGWTLQDGASPAAAPLALDPSSETDMVFDLEALEAEETGVR